MRLLRGGKNRDLLQLLDSICNTKVLSATIFEKKDPSTMRVTALFVAVITYFSLLKEFVEYEENNLIELI